MKIHTIDLKFCGMEQTIAAYLVESGGELALVETGPGSTLPALLEGIRELGHDPAAVSKVLLSHIHLDHAGAAGWWGNQGAQIFVHNRGVKHLVDPVRLFEGARSIYKERMQSLWGEVLPVGADRIVGLQDGDTVTVGKVDLQAWYTPGHAYHHIAFVADGLAFCGDVAGVRLPGANYISPATAPSQFDPEAYLHSIDRLHKANLRRLYLTHFGGVDDCGPHLLRYADIIRGVTGLVRAHVLNHAQDVEIVEAFTNYNRARARREDCGETMWQCYENANPSAMCADGIRLYFEKLQN